MPYEYQMPELLEHLLHTMKAILDLAEGIDSKALESEIVRATYLKVEDQLLKVIDHMVSDAFTPQIKVGGDPCPVNL